MGFLKNFFKLGPKPEAAPAPTPAPTVPPVPAHLPKIAAPSAAQIAKDSQPSPAAQALLTPQQTPSQYLNVLQEKQMGPEMVKTLAHGMPDREGVGWAAKSAEKVADKLPPDDLGAMRAAQAWVKSPTPETQAAAGAAAAKTNFSGPGAWAAQGAAWANPAPSAAAPRLTPHAVTGAVQLAAAIQANPALATPTVASAAIPAAAPVAPALQAPAAALAAPQAPPVVPPAVQAQAFQQQHPFIAMGIDIASGKTPVA